MGFIQLTKGAIAGLLATVILSIVMLIKKHVGFYLDFNPINALASLCHLPSPSYGWFVHFGIGVVFGVIFSIIYHKIPGEPRFRGCVFASIAWLFMMVTVMPLSGMGIFAIDANNNIAMFTFMMHLIFGVFLGLIYERLDRQ